MRKSGFYWVEPTFSKEWEIGYYNSDFKKWYLNAVNDSFQDISFRSIDERPIVREEPIAAKISGTAERISQNE